jgi:hypothetical protein
MFNTMVASPVLSGLVRFETTEGGKMLDGVAIIIDDTVYGVTPLIAELPTDKSYSVVATKLGYAVQTDMVVPYAGSEITVKIEMVKE